MKLKWLAYIRKTQRALRKVPTRDGCPHRWGVHRARFHCMFILSFVGFPWGKLVRIAPHKGCSAKGPFRIHDLGVGVEVLTQTAGNHPHTFSVRKLVPSPLENLHPPSHKFWTVPNWSWMNPIYVTFILLGKLLTSAAEPKWVNEPLFTSVETFKKVNEPFLAFLRWNGTRLFLSLSTLICINVYESHTNMNFTHIHTYQNR